MFDPVIAALKRDGLWQLTEALSFDGPDANKLPDNVLQFDGLACEICGTISKRILGLTNARNSSRVYVCVTGGCGPALCGMPHEEFQLAAVEKMQPPAKKAFGMPMGLMGFSPEPAQPMRVSVRSPGPMTAQEAMDLQTRVRQKGIDSRTPKIIVSIAQQLDDRLNLSVKQQDCLERWLKGEWR